MIGTKQQILLYLKDKGEEEIFEIKEFKENRTQRQNRLYWKWINDLVWCFDEKWIFTTSEDLHEWLKVKLIKWKYVLNSFTNKRELKRKSTTDLNKKEFSQYIKDIEKYLWQTFEITHPLPTDEWYNT